MAEKLMTDGSMALREKQYRVITIEATEKPQNAKLRVAAYARVSSASDDQLNSFAAQNRHYSDLISSKENWRMVDIYADEGITGTSAEKREDFQRLLADCRRGLIDRVLVKSISRFARNTKGSYEHPQKHRLFHHVCGSGGCAERREAPDATLLRTGPHRLFPVGERRGSGCSRISAQPFPRCFRLLPAQPSPDAGVLSDV